MAIKNPDGTVYQVGKGVNIIGDDGLSTRPEALLSAYDQHIIRRSGQPILYFRLLSDAQDADPLYGEIGDRITAVNGIRVWAVFEPEAPPQELTAFGIDGPEQRTFRVNRKEWFKVVGEGPMPGAKIFVGWDRTWWQVVQANHTEYLAWGKYGIEIVCNKYTRSVEDVDEGINITTDGYGHPMPPVNGDGPRKVTYRIV